MLETKTEPGQDIASPRALHFGGNLGRSVIGVVMKNMNVNFAQQGLLSIIRVRKTGITKWFVKANPNQFMKLKVWVNSGGGWGK